MAAFAFGAWDPRLHDLRSATRTHETAVLAGQKDRDLPFGGDFPGGKRRSPACLSTSGTSLFTGNDLSGYTVQLTLGLYRPLSAFVSHRCTLHLVPGHYKNRRRLSLRLWESLSDR